jgi:hypothetical protein
MGHAVCGKREGRLLAPAHERLPRARGVDKHGVEPFAPGWLEVFRVTRCDQEPRKADAGKRVFQGRQPTVDRLIGEQQPAAGPHDLEDRRGLAAGRGAHIGNPFARLRGEEPQGQHRAGILDEVAARGMVQEPTGLMGVEAEATVGIPGHRLGGKRQDQVLSIAGRSLWSRADRLRWPADDSLLERGEFVFGEEARKAARGGHLPRTSRTLFFL